MTYVPLFDPKAPAKSTGARPKGEVAYVYEPAEIALAVNVALATGRPLLVRGDPGCGKSTLAKDVSFLLDRRYEEEVVTSRTQAQDLQWRFDAVRRLADAQAKGMKDDHVYVEPGVLWRTFHPALALEHGRASMADGQKNAAVDERDVVVLIDEIDKADPDVPNDLLVVLDARKFKVPEIDRTVTAKEGLGIFMVITSNGERELPGAFLRRCVVLDIERPDRKRLGNITTRHFEGQKKKPSDALLDDIHKIFVELSDLADRTKRRLPGTAEFLDAVRACVGLGIDAASPEFRTAIDAAMWKHAPRGEKKKS